MKVSILVPVYGVEDYIVRCARSLFEQTFDEIEYVFIDDCSPDRSIQRLEEVLSEYPARKEAVKIIRHSKNSGLAHARNTAVEHATGEYILHVDSDDFLDTNAVELLYDKAVDEDADMVVFDFMLHTPEGVRAKTYSVPSDKVEHIERLLCRDVRCSWSMCNRFCIRNLYDHVRWVDGLNMGEDYATSPRLVYFSRKIVKLDMPFYNQCFDNMGSYTRNKLSGKAMRDIMQAVGVLNDFFARVPDAERYRSLVGRMKFNNKMFLLLSVSPELREEAVHCFPEIDGHQIRAALAEKILYNLAMRGMWRSFDLIVNTGKKVKHMLKV